MSTITMLIDLQYGSTGKGLAAAYLSLNNDYDMVISANMPNAGHTAYSPSGEKFMHKVLPSGIFGNPAIVGIGPGAVYDPDVLRKEINHAQEHGYLNNTRILVHENSVPLTKQMIDDEQRSPVTTIASTAQGSAAAMVAKIMRNANNPVTAAYNTDLFINMPNVELVNNTSWLNEVMGCFQVLAEGAQGYSLSLNGNFYPRATSRDCTTARFLADMSLPVHDLGNVIGVCRTYPIRVGNTDRGYSGGWYPDQEETSWKDLNLEPEMTTVTGRVRRVATFSMNQVVEACHACSVDEIFLNFANYMPTPDLITLINKIDHAVDDLILRPHVKYLGFGPKCSQVRFCSEFCKQAEAML